MDVTGYKPMKHIKMMNLTEIKRVVDIVDEEATGRFALVCRSNEVSVQTAFQNNKSRGLFKNNILPTRSFGNIRVKKSLRECCQHFWSGLD